MQQVLKRRKREDGEGNNLSVRPSSFTILLLATVFAFQLTWLSACGSEEPQTVQKSRTARKVKKKAVVKKKVEKQQAETAAEKHPKEEYFYDSTGKPDPFVPLITEIEPPRKKAKPEKQDRPLTPLQKYALDELKLVAIIKSGNRLSALFEDMSEFGYIVKEDTLIGKKGGIVKKITYDKVIIEESIYNSVGEIEKSIRSIKIQHQE